MQAKGKDMNSMLTEYRDAIEAGFYDRQHALPINRNAESGIIYYQTHDVCVIPLYRIEE